MLQAKQKKIQISLPSFTDEEWLALKEPLTSGWLTQGPKVAEFEQSFSEKHQVKHSLAVTSCTTGLHLALSALDIGPGDEVIVPAFTWIATSNVVLYCGATPIFCDVDTTTFNIKIDEISKKITSKTKAIIVVHLFGLCAEIEAIRAVVPSHIKIIEDSACAAGAEYKNIPAGGLGDVGVFSFHPRKSITTGEGGMITSNNTSLMQKIEILRNHGAEISEETRHQGPKPFLLPDFKLLGFNYRMTDLQAAIGIVQLNKLDKFISDRKIGADYYTENFKTLNWLKPQNISSNISKHAWQAYVCIIDPSKAPYSRNLIMEKLQEKGIATRPGTHAVHMLSFYKEKFKFKNNDFPGAYECDQYTIALPLHNKMTEEDFLYIVNTVKNL